MIRDYLSRVERTLSQPPLVLSVSFDTTIIDTDRGYWKATIILRSGFELRLFEFVAADGDQVEKYRYHCQDSDSKLVFRYDNAAHHPEVRTHPDHKHTPDGIRPAGRPDIDQVLNEAIEHVVMD